MAANQVRLYFSAFAGILMQAIREFGVKGTVLARAQFATLRLRLLKIAGSIKVTARRVTRQRGRRARTASSWRAGAG